MIISKSYVKGKVVGLSLFCFLISSCSAYSQDNQNTGTTIRTRFTPPAGFERSEPQTAWERYLQNATLLKGVPPIKDYRGEPISTQSRHCAILDLDVGSKDLQQCADALIRMRAEYLWQGGSRDAIAFHFTSGHRYAWKEHASGKRPVVQGSKVNFLHRASVDTSYSNFKNYLNYVFMYAGTISLERDLKPVSDQKLPIGTVVVEGGSPGHALMVVDRSENSEGKCLYILAQGFTPAQSVHILKADQSGNPWFEVHNPGTLDANRYYFSNPKFRSFE